MCGPANSFEWCHMHHHTFSLLVLSFTSNVPLFLNLVCLLLSIIAYYLPLNFITLFTYLMLISLIERFLFWSRLDSNELEDNKQRLIDASICESKVDVVIKEVQIHMICINIHTLYALNCILPPYIKSMAWLSDMVLIIFLDYNCLMC